MHVQAVYQKTMDSEQLLAIMTAEDGVFYLLCLILWNPLENFVDLEDIMEKTTEFCKAAKKQPNTDGTNISTGHLE